MARYNTANCHCCGEECSYSDGCRGRVVICKKCRKDPKKLKEAREAMIAHFKEEHGYEW